MDIVPKNGTLRIIIKVKKVCLIKLKIYLNRSDKYENLHKIWFREITKGVQQCKFQTLRGSYIINDRRSQSRNQ